MHNDTGCCSIDELHRHEHLLHVHCALPTVGHLDRILILPKHPVPHVLHHGACHQTDWPRLPILLDLSIRRFRWTHSAHGLDVCLS